MAANSHAPRVGTPTRSRAQARQDVALARHLTPPPGPRGTRYIAGEVPEELHAEHARVSAAGPVP